MSLEVDAWAQSLQVTESKVQGERGSFNVSSHLQSNRKPDQLHLLWAASPVESEMNSNPHCFKPRGSEQEEIKYSLLPQGEEYQGRSILTGLAQFLSCFWTNQESVPKELQPSIAFCGFNAPQDPCRWGVHVCHLVSGNQPQRTWLLTRCTHEWHSTHLVLCTNNALTPVPSFQGLCNSFGAVLLMQKLSS